MENDQSPLFSEPVSEPAPVAPPAVLAPIAVDPEIGQPHRSVDPADERIYSEGALDQGVDKGWGPPRRGAVKPAAAVIDAVPTESSSAERVELDPDHPTRSKEAIDYEQKQIALRNLKARQARERRARKRQKGPTNGTTGVDTHAWDPAYHPGGVIPGSEPAADESVSAETSPALEAARRAAAAAFAIAILKRANNDARQSLILTEAHENHRARRKGQPS